MQDHPKLIPGRYYHIYNRGINSCAIFREEENYRYFMWLYGKHVAPVVETYAWALLPTHFHFLVQVVPDLTGLEDLSGLKPAHQHLSNFFNAYSKSINKRVNRHGSLFERPFKRKPISSDNHMMNTLIYIHNNPVHHGYCRHPSEYGWSSYNNYFSENQHPKLIEFQQQFFEDRENFVYLHEHALNKLEEDDLLD
ncbi:MAG: hypothetical protein A2W85_06065 [Bacteroidetes bacterium GWF2_41_31]|nr:MAG: hypothetical protein A2W85_06065 [Bacteroidetes bacterium GWF2_41_31]